MAGWSAFEPSLRDAFEHDDYIDLRAGAEHRRFTSIWAVVVDGRVFVRSGQLTATGWAAALRQQGIAEVSVRGQRHSVVARPISDSALNSRINDAYRIKYGAAHPSWVDDVLKPGSMRSTLELAPSN